MRGQAAVRRRSTKYGTGTAKEFNFSVSKDLLDVPEGMLHLGSNAGFYFLSFQVVVIQFLPCAGSLGLST